MQSYSQILYARWMEKLLIQLKLSSIINRRLTDDLKTLTYIYHKPLVDWARPALVIISHQHAKEPHIHNKRFHYAQHADQGDF